MVVLTGVVVPTVTSLVEGDVVVVVVDVVVVVVVVVEVAEGAVTETTRFVVGTIVVEVGA